jgi:hypothetical protein
VTGMLLTNSEQVSDDGPAPPDYAQRAKIAPWLLGCKLGPLQGTFRVPGDAPALGPQMTTGRFGLTSALGPG